MENGRPWALGTSGCTVFQHGVELGLGHGQAIWGKAARAASYRQAGFCPDVMCSVVPHLAMALLVSSASGIPPGDFLLACLLR